MKKTLNLLYPALHAAVTMPLPKEDADAIEKDPKIEKTVLGKETLDAILTLPMVLPPTVLGYYLLVLIGRNGQGSYVDPLNFFVSNKSAAEQSR